MSVEFAYGESVLTFEYRLYCGFENAIESFDVVNPGATGTRHMLSPSRKAKQGQKGEFTLANYI